MEVAQELLAQGRAYKCYCTAEELQAMREQATAEKRPPRYDGRWRDRDPSEAPAGVKPSIRLKAPREGEVILQDLVQGTVKVQNAEMDDMIILRSDGTPTYSMRWWWMTMTWTSRMSSVAMIISPTHSGKFKFMTPWAGKNRSSRIFR